MMIPKRRRPWIAQQNWNDILFIHTPVAHETIRPVVPYPFKVDMYNNMGWVSIVLFQASDSSLRNMPSILSYPRFCQMNIRTYVRFGNERGVYFLKIHTDNRLVNAGGSLTGLPFTNADITMKKDGKQFYFKGQHLFDHPESIFSVTYEPQISSSTAGDSLSHFLSERYCIWLIRNHTIIRAPIFHKHWHLSKADITVHERKHFPFPITKNTITHYEHFKHAMIHPFERIGKVI